MREILFRGKSVDSGEWFYGHYVHQYGADMIYLPDGVDREYGFDYYHINAETVGQYTGLTDKNGKKIFEGDILNTSNSNCRIWYVDYKNTAFCANQGNANYSCVLDEFMQYSSVEIIGNIHDNPEFLKGE